MRNPLRVSFVAALSLCPLMATAQPAEVPGSGLISVPDRCASLAQQRDLGTLPLRREANATLPPPSGQETVATAPLRPRVRARKPGEVSFDPMAHTGRIVLKLADDEGFRIDANGLLAAANAQRAMTVSDLVTRSLGEAEVKRVFTRPELHLAFDRFCGERWTGEEMPDLTQFLLLAPREVKTAAAMEALVRDMNAMAFVEVAYFEGKSTPPPPPLPAARPKTEPLAWMQGYLNPAPQGIDAYHAWTHAGGNGQYAKIIDVEVAWRNEHEDLPPFFASIAMEVVPDNDPNLESYRRHGTAVVGMLVGNPAIELGVIGIANGSPIGVAATYLENSTIASAIDLASATLVPGDVILIERQIAGPPGVGSTPNCDTVQRDPGTQAPLVPAEFDHLVFGAIRTATANGRIVVAAAGNGGANLSDPLFSGRFDPANPFYMDSGAILVGAREPGTQLPTCESNYGVRIDVSAWGRAVTTAYWTGNVVPVPPATQNNTYSDEFSGTSSAAPMIAGVASLVQSIQTGRREPTLTSSAMRTLLRAQGTPQAASASIVGPMPDLLRIQMWMLADSDGDGMKNGVELALGRNPNVNEGAMITLIQMLLED